MGRQLRCGGGRAVLPVALAAWSLALIARARAEEAALPPLKLPTIEVVGTTPLPGLGWPLRQNPGNVQSGHAEQIAAQENPSGRHFSRTQYGRHHAQRHAEQSVSSRRQLSRLRRVADTRYPARNVGV